LRDGVTFAWPIVLLGLAALPLLVFLYVLSERRRVRSQAAFGNLDLIPNVVDRSPGKLRHLPLVLLLLALGAMIVGVARPHATVTVPREEATVILVMDTSRSMKATDLQPTRLDAARGAAKAFVAQVPEKFRIGVVSFSSRAVVGVPPTVDHALVDEALDTLTPGEATAIGDAVALALEIGADERAEDGSLPPRTILLFSDGKREGGEVDPADAATAATEQGVPVHTVLVGTPNGVLEEMLPGGFRRITRVPANPETLAKLSQATGGTFFTAFDSEGLQTVYEELGSRLGEREEQREVTDLVAGGAALLLLAGGALSAFLFRRVP
jgi:Ca-activated chloride channel homolog